MKAVQRVDEPVVVNVSPLGDEPAGAALADVLVITATLRRGASRCADLFARYPGLTLVLVTDATGGVLVGVRGGGLLTTLDAHRRWLPATSAKTLARLLYACWTARRLPSGPDSGEVVVVGGIRFRAGCWRAASASGGRFGGG